MRMEILFRLLFTDKIHLVIYQKIKFILINRFNNFNILIIKTLTLQYFLFGSSDLNYHNRIMRKHLTEYTGKYLIF